MPLIEVNGCSQSLIHTEQFVNIAAFMLPAESMMSGNVEMAIPVASASK
jgi:hypothetical protein